ncbi:MAG: hypothetical protein Kow0029_03680 [Candidatus Rifleibacteriota bacterium]
MGIIAKTLTKGFRTCYFRNQPVHHFYGHLQAVLKDIDPSGEMGSLFAKPDSHGNAGGIGQEVEWSTDLSGEAKSFKDLTPEKQQEIAGLLSVYIEKIRKYAESKQGKTGVEKDYAEYLKAVAVSPDLNQVFVVNNKPVLVHWGFICESANHPGQGIYAGWDEFIAQVQRKASAQAAPPSAPSARPKEEPRPVEKQTPQEKKEVSPEQAAAAAAAVFAEPPEDKKEETKPKEEEKKAPIPAKKEKKKKKEEKKILACGLGDYQWVKWLAILHAIIILLLLLLRFLLPHNPMRGMGGISGMPPGLSSGGSMPSSGNLPGGGTGSGLPGGSGSGLPSGSGSGLPGGSGNNGEGKNSSKQGRHSPHICPHCGHAIDVDETGNFSSSDDSGKTSDKHGANPDNEDKIEPEKPATQDQSSSESARSRTGNAQPQPGEGNQLTD